MFQWVYMPVNVYATYNYTCHEDTTVHVILHVYVINALYSVYACVLQAYRYNACVHVFKFSIVWFAAPEIVELEVLSTRELTKGEMAHISYPFNPKIGVTLQYRVEEGTLNVYGSFNVRNPTQSTADFSFVAELQTTYFVSPEKFNEATGFSESTGMQLNGRSPRQAVSDNTTAQTLFTSVTGLNEMNNFNITTVPGDDPGTFSKLLLVTACIHFSII